MTDKEKFIELLKSWNQEYLEHKSTSGRMFGLPCHVVVVGSELDVEVLDYLPCFEFDDDGKFLSAVPYI